VRAAWRFCAAAVARRPVTVGAVAIVTLKLCMLILDPTPNLFMGDLQVFLDTAVYGAIPTARPWVYGGVLRVLSVGTGSLLPLLLAQAVSGAVAAVLVVHMVRVRFGVRPWLAVAAGCALALAPHQLYWERAVMTESFATTALVLVVAVLLRYLDRPGTGDLVLTGLVATAAVALRTQLLPTVVSTMLAAPVVAGLATARGLKRKERARVAGRSGVHVLVAVAVLLAGVSGLRQLNAELTGRPPALQWEDGYFLIAAWAPVVRPEDAPDPRVSEAIAAPTEFPLAEHRRLLDQRWAPGALVDRIKKLDPDPILTNRWAKTTALNALRRDPIGVAALALDTWRLNFDRDVMRWMIDREQGLAFAPTPHVIRLLSDELSLAVTADWCRRWTLSRAWHRAAEPWFGVLVFAPLIGAAAVGLALRWALPAVALTAWMTVPLLATAVAFNLPVPRMLHPLEPFTIALLAVIVDAAVRLARRHS
jgi:hypothetical protein